jgi:3-dehydroquinate synthase
VVSEDEKENDLRRILNFGHTFGHALEAETSYERFLHGEAVAWGMKAALHLSGFLKMLDDADQKEMLACIDAYGPLPPLKGISRDRLAARLVSDKKTVQGKIHFVLAEGIGRVRVVSSVAPDSVNAAIDAAFQ